MRVCFFIPSFYGAGAQRQCIGLLNAIQHSSGIETHLILLGSGDHDDSLDISRLKVHKVELQNFADPRALVFVVQTLRKVRPDLLISFLHPADIWSYAATRLLRGIPWVLTERDSSYPDQFVFKARKAFGRRGADAIIANSEQGRELWARLAPRAPIYVIPNMVVDTGFDYTNPDRSSLNSCLFVGRLEWQKNVIGMTRAFAHFSADHTEAELKLAGRGTQDNEVREIAQKYGLTDRIELLGFRKDVAALMHNARVFLSFSRHEGMPNVVMEAVLANLPAVVTDIPQHRALLGNDYPYYVDLDSSPEAAATVIARAWDNHKTDGDGLYAHARGVLANMSPEKVTQQYIDVFKRVVRCDHSTVEAYAPRQRRNP